MKYVLFIVLFIGAAIIACLFVPRPTEVDARTSELCREYAARDHRGEIAPARYEWLGKDFVDNFDWYGSCINHTLHPVAGR